MVDVVLLEEGRSIVLDPYSSQLVVVDIVALKTTLGGGRKLGGGRNFIEDVNFMQDTTAEVVFLDKLLQRGERCDHYHYYYYRDRR